MDSGRHSEKGARQGLLPEPAVACPHGEQARPGEVVPETVTLFAEECLWCDVLSVLSGNVRHGHHLETEPHLVEQGELGAGEAQRCEEVHQACVVILEKREVRHFSQERNAVGEDTGPSRKQPGRS